MSTHKALWSQPLLDLPVLSCLTGVARSLASLRVQECNLPPALCTVLLFSGDTLPLVLTVAPFPAVTSSKACPARLTYMA